VDFTPGLQGFEARLDTLRVEHAIPDMSAAIVEDAQVVWTRGLGFADIAAGKPVTESTCFHLASLTKPFASVIIMQLVEGGLLDLDDPVSDYGIDLSSQGVILVRHLLTHTSEGVPGAVEAHRSEPLRPGQFRPDGSESGRAIGFSSAAGLISSARDMATFASAIDQGMFLEPATWQAVFTPAVSNGGSVLPYGLGWFIQQRQGVELQWHYGHWYATSTLIVRAPAVRRTFIVMANTDMMSRPYDLGAGDVWRSLSARLFLESYVYGDAPLPAARGVFERRKPSSRH
jgi:CubicO group peptidase (beta-lactamase class C family)